MKKLVTLFVGVLLIAVSVNAQGTWTFAAPTDGAGTATAESGRAICTDASGNTYVTGVFNGGGGATDFDLNNSQLNTFTSSGNDGYIASYDKNGNFRWKTIVSGTGSDFAAPNGGICTNGTFVWVAGSAAVSTGAPTIMSSTNTVTITSPGTGVDAFVAKMNCSNGSVVWQQGFGGTGANDFGMGICVDPSGCCYVSGSYSTAFTLGSVSFPAPGGPSDAYIAKFTPSGVLRAVQTGGSTGNTDFVNAGCGLVYVPGTTPAIVATGNTGGSLANFGAFTGLANAGLNDAVLLELDTAVSAFSNAMVIGSAAADELISAVYDPFSGGVFVSGFCSGNITFPGTPALTGLGQQDIIIARYNVATNLFVWSSIAGGAGNDRGWCITSDTYGGILLSGHTTSAPCTFSGSVSIAGNAGLNDLYVARYNPSGVPAWVLTAAGAGSEEARSIASYVETTPSYVQNIFVTGITNTTGVSFGAFPVGCDGGNDFFLAKLTDGTFTPPLSATQSQVNLTCNGVCNGSATVVASGGTSPYTYSWSPSGGSGATASSLCAGTYTCTITDAAASSITRTFNITQPTAITLNANTQTNVSCFGGSNGAASVIAASGGTPGYTYNWTPGNPTGDGTVSVTGLIAGTWTCTVTDASSCTTTRTFNITQPSAIVVTPASQTNISCNGGNNGAASINTPTGGAGGYTYNWTPGNPVGDGTVSVSGLTTGTWTCTVTDANSCTATQTFNITQPPALTVLANSQTNVACFGGATGAASVTVSGGVTAYSYNWTPGNPTGDGTASVTGLIAGTWTCTVTDANSCVATRTFNITQPTAIVVTPASQTNVSCFGGANGAASINTPTGGAGGYTYNWTPGNPTGDGTVSVTGLIAGTWTCTVTDANSCTATQTFNITQPSAIVVTPASQTNISCFGGSNGAASINTPTGGAGGFTYNWTPGNPTGDGTVSVTGLIAGTWTCTVTDANSCTATQTFTITQPTVITASISSTPTSCSANTGTATVSSVSGGAGGYTYSWAPTGGTAATATALAAGNYTCTITDVNSCSITRTVTVATSAGPTLTAASQTNVSCFGGANGAASVNAATGGTSPYTYNWTPGNPTGDGTVSVTGLTAGTWTCTVTDAGGCTANATFNITQPPALVVTPASQTNVSCFGGANGAASVTVSGGTTAYSYNWTPGNPTGDGTASVTGLIAGTWTCTVTDANSCTATQTFNITSPTAISVTPASQTNVSCFGGANGAASINTPTGGAGGYTYNWTPGNPAGDGTVSVTGLIAGTWTCTVTDANSCTATQTFNITQPAAIVVTPASQTNVSCNAGANGAASINTPTGGAGGFTYNWTPGNPTGDGTVSVTGLTAGTWTCTVTDANSCTATQTFTITQPTAITANISSTPTSCTVNTGTATVSSVSGGAGSYTYSWAPAGGTGTTASNLAAGTYTCTITDANSCSITRTVTVTTSSGPTLTAAAQTNVSCFGGSNGAASVNAATGGTSPYTYNWTPGNPTGDGTVSVTGLTAGTWTCTVTDAGGCTATVTFNITQPPALVAAPASQTNVSCFGGANGAASVTVSGGTTAYSYNWTPGNPTGDGTASVTGLIAGTWTCTVTDANSCTATQTFNITAPAALVVSPASQTNISCNGGTNGAASVSVTGGTTAYTYNWTPGNPTGDGTASVTGLTAGTWTCTVTDANSCTATATFNITAPAVLAVSPASQTNISCNGGTNGAASVSVTGGTTAYTYNWTPGNPTGDGTASVTGLTAGTWTCTVTDANSCVASATFNITQPLVLLVNAVAQTNVSCFGGSNGAAAVTVSGGTTAYSYNWTPGNPTGDGTASVTGLTAGTWTCTVTDANSCVATRTFNITQPPALVVTPASQSNVSCFGGTNGSASVSVSGGTPTYSYNWTPGNPSGDGTAGVTGLTAGTWTCTVTDANGCTATATFNITSPPALVVTPSSQTNVLCNGGTTGAASVTVSGGTTAYSYNWTPGNPTGDGTAAVTGLAAGTWTCTVTDANSCTASATFNITQPTAITANITSTPTSCTANTGTATVSAVTGGVSPYSYNWTPGNPTGDGTPAVTGLAVGNWTCTITDANGCSITRTVNVVTASGPALTALSQTNILCNGNASGAASVNAATGGTTPYTYNWTPGNPTGDGTTAVTGLTAGTWTCTVTDANGCTASVTFNITQPTALAVAPASQTNVSCNAGNNGAASVTVSGGTTAYAYNWTPGNPTGDGTASVTGLTAGTWTCTVTDANGCSATQTFNITQPNALAVTPASQTNILCNGGNNGAASVTVSGGTTAYVYNWTPGNPTGDGTASVTGLVAGTYTCTVTDANSCISTATFNITQPPVLVVTPSSQTNVTCFGGNDGAATGSVTGGTPSYTYSWTPSGGNGATALGLTAGVYTLTVTDANSCTATATFNITEPPAVVVNVSASANPICAGDCSVLTATGGVTYNWAPGFLTGNPVTVCPPATTTYTVTGTDMSGCFGTATITVTVNPLPVVSITGDDSICAGDSSLLTGTSGGTSQWYFNGVLIPGATSNTYMASAAGVYNMIKTNVNTCADSAATGLTLIINALPAVTANASLTNVCDGNTVILTGSGASSYTWDNSVTDGVPFTPLATASYVVTGTDVNGCVNTDTIIVTVNPLPVVALGNDTSTCAGSTILLDAGNAGSTYLWIDSTAGQTLLASTNGTYWVDVTNTFGCTSRDSITLTFASAFAVTLGNDTAFCGDTLLLDAGNPGYSYLWNDSTTAQTLAAAVTGTYYVTVTDSIGCTASDSINITITNGLNVALGSDMSNCTGSAITLDAGAFNNASYMWNDSTTAQTLTANSSGTYYVTVTDSINGCSGTDTISVAINTAPVVNIGGTISSCATSYTFDAGTSGNVYLWIDSTTTQFLTVNTNGTYWVTVTDSVSGCSSSDTATITFTIPPVVTFTLSVDSICNTEPAFGISGTPAGGIFTGFGVVNGNQFSPGIGGPGVNVVTYTYTDGTGCSVSASDSLFVFQCIGINEVNSSITMNLYPNPNMGVFTIEAHSLNQGNIEVQIFNTLGQVIDAFPMTESKRTIDITGYEGGIYSVRLTDGTSVLTQRVIKQ